MRCTHAEGAAMAEYIERAEVERNDAYQTVRRSNRSMEQEG